LPKQVGRRARPDTTLKSIAPLISAGPSKARSEQLKRFCGPIAL